MLISCILIAIALRQQSSRPDATHEKLTREKLSYPEAIQAPSALPLETDFVS
ncbi:MAG: hypothetical protein WA885_22245 [Phormidesmis sp.]